MIPANQRTDGPPDLDRRRAALGKKREGRFIWVAAFVAIIVYTIIQLQIFSMNANVLVGGSVVSVPRTFFTVDHPFHIVRADVIREAWLSLDTIRWIASHQGGYPSEFYPFGLPAATALFSVISLGILSVQASWVLTVTLIFLLPGLAYVVLARQDSLSPAVALVGMAAHLVIASDWTHGGYTELVEWGLATNVAGATVALLAIPLLLGAVRTPSFRYLASASVLIGFCAMTNPRSLIGVSVIAAVVLVQQAFTGPWRPALVRIGVVSSLAAALAAPVLFPLVRYRDLYFFLSYQEYGSVNDYLDATVDSVTLPVLVVALVGVVIAFTNRQHVAARVCAMGLIVYVTITLLAVISPEIRGIVPQLELPRLMPFQRLLTVYLAGYGLIELMARVLPVAKTRASLRDGMVAAVTTLALVVVFTTDIGAFPSNDRGLRDVPRTDDARAVELAEFEQAIDLADASAPDNTAILVIGTRLSWHEQLWAPMFAEDRRFYYDNWLWYWHRLHDGPYDYRVGHHYPNPSETLTDTYLANHGIGAVVVTDLNDQNGTTSARMEAMSSSLLQDVDSRGSWDVYLVGNPVSLATLEGENADRIEVSPDNETITIQFADAEPGMLRVRQNWFPRWTASVNGAAVAVSRADEGYMSVPIADAGDVDVELRYTVTALDVIARVVSGLAIAFCLLFFLIPIGLVRRWAH